ncbi:MAG TPA: DUF5123 domain-containing protein [Chitinophagaceae bacterium]
MKSLFKYVDKKTVPALLIIVLLVGCARETPEIEDPNLPRMFTPVGLRLTVSQTQVKIEWNPSLFSQDKDVQYTVEVSKDSSFQSAPDFTKVVDTTVIIVTDADIAIRQRYFARIKANSSGSSAESKWMVSPPFTMTGEQIFVVPVPESDIIDNAVILRWTPTPGVTKIVITLTGGSPVDVTISAADNTAGFKMIGGLTGSTTYSAEIFAGTRSKGLLSFTTKATITGTNIIDLRGITNRPSVLADTIPFIPSGSIVILKRGLTYNIVSTTSLNKSMTILSGADFIPDLATIFLGSNFNLTAGAAIDSLVFKDLNMYSDNYAAKYVFNINQVGTIGKVRFENVRGHRFRGFFRMQTGGAGTKVTDLSIENCVIDSLRDFSLVNTNNSNTVANIHVSNTTLYSARKVIDHRSPGSNSIKFENCTFYNLPGGGASTPPGGIGGFYFIDLGTQNSAMPIIITNCIFGKTWDDQGLGNDARGIQAGTSTTVSVTNSYQASDFISTNVLYQISLIPYSGPSSSLFVDPENGNFRIKDNAFAGNGNCGDPRWY